MNDPTVSIPTKPTVRRAGLGVPCLAIGAGLGVTADVEDTAERPGPTHPAGDWACRLVSADAAERCVEARSGG